MLTLSEQTRSRRTEEAIDVECIKKKSGVEHVFHQLPRHDSLSLRSETPPAGPKSGWFYVIREVLNFVTASYELQPFPSRCSTKNLRQARDCAKLQCNRSDLINDHGYSMFL